MLRRYFVSLETKATIKEKTYYVKLSISITSVRSNYQSIYFSSVVVIVSISDRSTDSPIVAKIVTYFRYNRESCVVSVPVAPKTNFATNKPVRLQ